MTLVLELYDVKATVADIEHLKRSVREALGSRVVLTLVIPTGHSARIAVIRDDEIPLDVEEELNKGGIKAIPVLKSPIIGISESPEFVREVLRAYEKYGPSGAAALVSGMNIDKIIEKVGQVLPLEVILKLNETPKANIAINDSAEPKKKRLIHKDGSEDTYDPDKILDDLVKSGISSKIAKKALAIVEGLLPDDFVIDYEINRALKNALAVAGDYKDITAYEGYSDFSSRVYIDGKEFSNYRLIDVIRSAIELELKPSATLIRQLRDFIVDLIRKLAEESRTTIHLSSDRIKESAKTLLYAEMPYLRSKKPREEAYTEAVREFNIAKHMLEFDRGEAIRLLESATEHALRAIALSKGIIPPLGIRRVVVSVKDELSEALIKRLKLLESLKEPANRYNKRLVNAVIEAIEELLSIASHSLRRGL